MFGKCICIKDYKVFKKGQKYQYEVGRYVLIFHTGDETFTIGESEFYNYFRDCD